MNPLVKSFQWANLYKNGSRSEIYKNLRSESKNYWADNFDIGYFLISLENKLTLVSPGWIGSVSSALSSALDSNTLAGLK